MRSTVSVLLLLTAWAVVPWCCRSFSFLPATTSYHRRSLVVSSSSTADTDDDAVVDTAARNAAAARLVRTARTVGQVGSRATEEERATMVALAQELAVHTDPAPARITLGGTHDLVYSASPGGSSGALGPWYTGTVTQQFPNASDFVNGVRLGPLRIDLRAVREILDDARVKVTFRETVVSVLGVELVRQESKGKGVWKHLFAGVVELEGKDTFLRVLETPSLFVIQQEL